MNDNGKNLAVDLKIPFSTILTILFTLLIVHMLENLAPMMMPLFIGGLLAVALTPLITWMEAHRVPRWLAILLMTAGLIALMITIFGALIPRMMDEFTAFMENLPQLRIDLLKAIDPQSPLRPVIEQNLTKQALLPTNYNFSHFYGVGTAALGGLSELFLILIFAIYLVADGERVIKWSTAFFSLSRRAKIRLTFHEVSEIIFAYASGQFITSLLSFVFCFIVLSALSVPGALLLAVLAGIFDVLPVLGFVLAVFPAMLFAFKVSSITPLYVFLLYILYHALENYLIAPMVYGNRLRISGFTVLVATLAAGFLAGIEGAISILPVVASYPVIEKIWLKPFLGETVVDEHHRMGNEPEELKV